MDRYTKPKLVARDNALENRYLQPDGSWGEGPRAWNTAKRFPDESTAQKFAAKYGKEICGLFPVSVRHRIR